MMQLAGERLSIEEACRTVPVSRAGFYRHFDEHAPRQAETELRDRIQRVALENRFYGYRRVAAELRRQGVVANHKRVLRVMREDNLLSLRKRRFVVTTDSRHFRPIYPNLLAGRELTAPHQAWVADITYIRLREEFIFLAVVLDAFSRRVVGWELGESLQASLVLQALNRALAERPVPPGIIHHSDQGVQYASEEYVSELRSHGFLVSMSRSGNPYDNAAMESFFKTLKYEEVYLFEYETLADVLERIPYFIERCIIGKDYIRL